MATRVLSPDEVRSLLPMSTCIDVVEAGFRTLAEGRALNPLRSGIRIPDKCILGWMPGYIEAPEALGAKIVTVFPGNHGTGFDAHQGIVLLFDPTNGVPMAIVDASEVTAIRTAAASAVATRVLAREDASVLAMIGSGVQARTHLEAMCLVREISMVRVFSAHPRSREAFAARESARRGVPVVAVATAEEAVRDADLVCTTTSAREPIVHGAWIRDGTHINAVGSSVKTTRELDTDAVVRSRLYVDRRESTINEAGDYLMPLAEGAITDAHIVGEIGAILMGTLEGRRTAHEITLFKSLGLAVEDLVAARHVYDRAVREGIGIDVDLGGRREGPG